MMSAPKFLLPFSSSPLPRKGTAAAQAQSTESPVGREDGYESSRIEWMDLADVAKVAGDRPSVSTARSLGSSVWLGRSRGSCDDGAVQSRGFLPRRMPAPGSSDLGGVDAVDEAEDGLCQLLGGLHGNVVADAVKLDGTDSR
jgi:hypothetical protein